VSLPDFAARHDYDIDVLRALCEALYSIGIFTREGDVYRLDERGKLIVDVLHGWLEVSYAYSEVFNSLEPLVRKKKMYGKDFYRLSDYVGRGSGEMESWLFFPLANQIILENRYERVLDLGCGDGTFLRKLCELNPNVRCFGIDLAPAAIEDGRRAARNLGLQDRICLHAADIIDVDAIPAEFRTAQAATLFFVLHEILYTAEESLIDFLRAFRKAFPNVPLIVFEAIRPTACELRAKPGFAIYYFLYHDLSHQKPVDRARWRKYFELAGFNSIEERYLPFARTAIYNLR
jgi:SAM-dependent methyltransferase